MNNELPYIVNKENVKLKRIDVRKGNALKKSKLKSILSEIICVDKKDISLSFINDIITIAQGKMWSEEFDNRSKQLAEDINTEFDLYSNENNL